MLIPLNLKSCFSLGYGTARPAELAERCGELGYPAAALADRDSLYGLVRFHHECRLRGIRPITAVQLASDHGDHSPSSRRIILLARDSRGYGNLCRIITRRQGIGAGRSSGLDQVGAPGDLTHHMDGLFLLSDDPAVVERLLSEQAVAAENAGILLQRPAFLPLDHWRQQEARRLGVRLVADLDVVFLHPDDHALHTLLFAIRKGKTVSEVATDPDLADRQRWLRSPEDAAALFADVPDAVQAAEEIADACRFDLESIRGKPVAPAAGAKEISQRLHALCNERIAASRGWTTAHETRLEYELALFEQLGFSRLILTVAEILLHCRENGFPVAIRGSAVSSLALHLLGGSPIDPLRHGLLFERFLHPGKTSWPDIDIDLPWHRRDEVIEWVYNRFGRDRVAMVSAHHLFQRRAALREGLKAFATRPSLIERLARALPPDDLDVADFDFLGLADLAASEDPLEAGHLNRYGGVPNLPEILQLVRRLIGLPRHLAAHPGGIVITEAPLGDLLPLEVAPKGVVVTQYDAASIERLGLVKIDLLGNRCLSELEEIFADGGDETVRLDAIPADDPATLSLIDRAETIGCFQLESPTMRSLLARIPIRSQDDVVAALGLIRPGAAAGRVKNTFIRRARGEEPAEPAFPALAERLHGAYGLLLYEEDIMALLAKTGGITLGEADELRGGIIRSGGDREVLAVLERRFMELALQREPNPPDMRLLKSAWHTAARFAAYSFNKAHAASYGVLAYLSAYAKVHRPTRFAAALLNHHEGLYPLRTIAAALMRRGVAIHSPQVNISGKRSEVETTREAVRVGFDRIKGLSERSAARIVAERSTEGPFHSLRELLERVSLNQREIAALVLCGACDGLFPLSAENYPFVHEAALELLREGAGTAELDAVAGTAPSGGDEKQVRLYRRLVRVRNELHYMEMHLAAHPMALLREEAARYGCITIEEAASRPAGTKTRLAATVAAMRRAPTRQGPIQFITFEDETGLLEAAVLPAEYRLLGERVTTPGPFLVEGTIRIRHGVPHLEATWFVPFHERKRPYGKAET